MSDKGYSATVHGLIRRCGELHSEIEALRGVMDARMAELDQLAVAIRVFKPDIDPADLPARPAPPASAAFRGEVQRFLLATLRTADAPRTTSQMTECIMASRSLSTADTVLWKLIRGRTGHSLANLRKKGFVESRRYSGASELEWWSTMKGGEPTGGWRNGSG